MRREKYGLVASRGPDWGLNLQPLGRPLFLFRKLKRSNTGKK